MKATIFLLLLIFSLLITALTIGSEANKMEKLHELNKRLQCISPIAAFTADGHINRLKPASKQGLAAVLTANEIKEVMVHLYAYTSWIEYAIQFWEKYEL